MWLPSGRLRSATLASLAAQRARAGLPEKAVSLLDEALAVDPTNEFASLLRQDWLTFGVGRRAPQEP